MHISYLYICMLVCLCCVHLIICFVLSFLFEASWLTVPLLIFAGCSISEAIEGAKLDSSGNARAYN